MKEADRRKPVLKGKIYCAPACGGNCTKKEYDRLRKLGLRLAAQLGSGWKIRLHESLQWFMEVISPCGRIKVGPDYDYNVKVNGIPTLRGYNAYITEPNDCGILYSARKETPLEAVRAVILTAQETLEKRGAAIVDPTLLQYLSLAEDEAVTVEDTRDRFMGCRILLEVDLKPGEQEGEKKARVLHNWRKFMDERVPDTVERVS